MKVVIVGGVAAGATLATSLRRLDENIEIIIFEKDRDMSFGNCELPYYLSYEIKDSKALVNRTPDTFRIKDNIRAYTYHEVTAINREEKTVRVLDKLGNKSFDQSYDYLILATGAHPNVPGSIKGTNLDHVFSLRNVVDAENIRKFYENNSPENIFIGGGGFIAIEAAHALNSLGGCKVNLFVRGKILGPIDDEFKALIEENILANGVDIIHEKNLVEITENEAIFESGKRVPANMVILALGMLANNKLAIDSGLELTPRGSILTDDSYRTSDPSIFAIGDNIDSKNFITGQRQNLKLAWPAHRQAKHLAHTLANENTDEVDSFIGTFLIKSFDLNIGMTGLNEKSLIDLGYAYDSTIITYTDKVAIMPNAKSIYLKVLFDKDDGKIYGAQALGEGNIDKRIDVIATLIKMEASIYDMYKLELGYQPYYSRTEDAVNILASQAINIKEKNLLSVKIPNLINVLDDFVIYDIRSKEAYQKSHIKKSNHLDLSLEDFAKTIPADKKILVYDYNGVRSSKMIKRLDNYGIKNVYMLDGGMVLLEKYSEYFHLSLIEK